MFGRGYPVYVPAWKKQQRREREAAKLRKSERDVQPVAIAGRAIATTFWGKAWCDHLETIRDYAYRLERGRSYVRAGAVLDLRIHPGRIEAKVSGTRLYSVEATLKPLAPAARKALVRACAGGIGSVVELLSGKLSDAVMTVLCAPEHGLFPTAQELSLSCSCPDGAWVCKHVAAALYGVGARLDERPELLFVLRGLDQTELVSEAAGAGLLGGGAPPERNELGGASLEEVFGIELDTRSAPVLDVPPRREARTKERSADRVAQRVARDPAAIAADALGAMGFDAREIRRLIDRGGLMETVAPEVFLKTRTFQDLVGENRGRRAGRTRASPSRR